MHLLHLLEAFFFLFEALLLVVYRIPQTQGGLPRLFGMLMRLFELTIAPVDKMRLLFAQRNLFAGNARQIQKRKQLCRLLEREHTASIGGIWHFEITLIKQR